MTVPEAVNRLLHEIKKALPYWEEHLMNIDDIYIALTDSDAEVEEALKNLIKAIQEDDRK